MQSATFELLGGALFYCEKGCWPDEKGHPSEVYKSDCTDRSLSYDRQWRMGVDPGVVYIGFVIPSLNAKLCVSQPSAFPWNKSRSNCKFNFNL